QVHYRNFQGTRTSGCSTQSKHHIYPYSTQKRTLTRHIRTGHERDAMVVIGIIVGYNLFLRDQWMRHAPKPQARHRRLTKNPRYRPIGMVNGKYRKTRQHLKLGDYIQRLQNFSAMSLLPVL